MRYEDMPNQTQFIKNLLQFLRTKYAPPPLYCYEPGLLPHRRPAFLRPAAAVATATASAAAASPASAAALSASIPSAAASVGAAWRRPNGTDPCTEAFLAWSRSGRERSHRKRPSRN